MPSTAPTRVHTRVPAAMRLGLAVLALCLLSAGLSAPAAAEDRLYEFETAFLKYAYAKGKSEGVRVVYIADHGRLRYEDTTRSGFGSDVHETIIYKGDTAYNIDWDKKRIEKSTVKRQAIGFDVEALVKKLGSLEAAYFQLTDQGVYLRPDEPVLGYMCQSWIESTGREERSYAAYRGVPMTMKLSRKRRWGEERIEEQMSANKAQFDIWIEPGRFELPEGFQIVD